MQSLNGRVPLIACPSMQTKLIIQYKTQNNRKLYLKMQSISEDEVKIQSKQVEGEVKSSTESVVEQNNEQQEDKNLVSSTVEDVDDMFAVKELWDEVKSSEEMGKRGEAFFLAQVLILFLIFFPPFEIQGLLAIYVAWLNA
eukprot:TRINITY_DN10836_c0_g1_i3.p1 TRINITY_DN10836_c0_g1~~TRINITY_DN10836_c0_g1_i3.p1  ORF type:complete len:156 (-),score=26.83 TRINITY_DN10836_c0_g1_i3:21-443(-)